MEVMEDGNLMDKVNILIQRDMEYYKAKQAVLQETICPGIIGGKLDFPRSASFAAVKLAVWWEEEYVAAYRKPSGTQQYHKINYNNSTFAGLFQKNIEGNRENDEALGGCGGVVRSSDPSKFIVNLSKSADQLLEHLHLLTQEALDHADLTVLTGTIGAAALLKNCLWFYIQVLNDDKNLPIQTLQAGHKKYNEMCEALAERLLDLHSRLLSLYILQDADCLDWENEKPFFESERGSYTIQMWWLYMQGTKEDLWDTVPPKMAQRVFSGMLNESLTILTVRYTQSVPTEARNQLLLVDVTNLLMCVAQLLPTICETAEELLGTQIEKIKSKILRDIHVKCQELYVCLLLRGASLDSLQKQYRNHLQVFKKSAVLFNPKANSPAGWLIFSLPDIFSNSQKPLHTLELVVLLAQPQPNWALLLKVPLHPINKLISNLYIFQVLCKNNFKILHLMLKEFMEKFQGEIQRNNPKTSDCGNFLCPGDGSCKDVETTTPTLNNYHYHELIFSATEVLLHVADAEEIKNILLEIIVESVNWAKCFERRNVWNQIRPPWYEAMLNIASPILSLIEENVINALQTGATMYQAMSLVIACLSQFWDMIDPSLLKISNLLQEIIPVDVTPVSNSVLMQILVSALYSSFIDTVPAAEEQRRLSRKSIDSSSRRTSTASLSSSAIAAAEALCSIDEDNKHTDQIEEFLVQVNEAEENFSMFINASSTQLELNQEIVEIVVSDLLTTTRGKRSLKILFHFMKYNKEWLFFKLGISPKTTTDEPNRVLNNPEPLLHKMFHIGYHPFDQLLTNNLKPNWQHLLQNPMGITREKVWTQLSCRWEFQSGASARLSICDNEIVGNLSLMLKQ
ncbi:LOW QUALITY PROTEIN: uncharacterized protein KIAA0825 homolog [Euwallacea similis]|uniref:LOW QUALITY PROTEIN: uncharacterized protein KIAA0825 homolog n=1 Tax=Euwallacea similis TaxID=1736056 RepID=UPI00344C696E